MQQLSELSVQMVDRCSHARRRLIAGGSDQVDDVTDRFQHLKHMEVTLKGNICSPRCEEKLWLSRESNQGHSPSVTSVLTMTHDTT